MLDEGRRRRPAPGTVHLDAGTSARPRDLVGPVDDYRPTDRLRAEAAVRAYAKGPTSFRWVGSPLGVVTALLDVARTSGLEISPAGAWSLVTDLELHRAMAGVGQAEIRRRLGESGQERLPDVERGWQIAQVLGSSIRAAIGEANDAHLSAFVIGTVVADAGQFDDRSAILSALDRVDLLSETPAPSDVNERLDEGEEPDETVRVIHRPDPRFLTLAAELRDSAGAAAVVGDEVTLSERPVALHVDAEGRPHSEVGPAIEYADGFGAYAVHGVAVPAWLITSPDRLNATLIEVEPNAEVRRVMFLSDTASSAMSARVAPTWCTRTAPDACGASTSVEHHGDGPAAAGNARRTDRHGRGHQQHARARRVTTDLLPARATRYGDGPRGGRLYVRDGRRTVRANHRNLTGALASQASHPSLASRRDRRLPNSCPRRRLDDGFAGNASPQAELIWPGHDPGLGKLCGEEPLCPRFDPCNRSRPVLHFRRISGPVCPN